MNTDINHYLETICNPHGRFRTLEKIGFHLNARGTPDFQAGSCAVIFKTVIAGEKFAMKCYTKANENRRLRQQAISAYLNPLNHTYLPCFEYLDEEIYVFDDTGKGSYHPVTLTQWVEGISLRSWLICNCRTKNREGLLDMAENFRQLSLGLLEQTWAHGDLKPDNMIVSGKGALHLIDFDNVFIPDFTGMHSPELGTPGFQHPLRNTHTFDRNLDDYSIALIGTALFALSEFPEWYTEQEDEEILLFDPARVLSGHCERLHAIKDHWLEQGRTDLYRLATLIQSPSPTIESLPGILRQIPADQRIEPPNTTKLTLEVYRENGFYGYRTLQGNRITEPVYEDAQDFQENLAAVRIGKKRYYIGTDSRKRIDVSEYDRTEAFSSGLAAVEKGKKWGYIDLHGKPVIPPQFQMARPFREELAAVQQDGRWGYIDRTGVWVIPPLYDQAFDFREQVAVAAVHGKFGYITPTGRWLTEVCFSFASGFRNGRATAEADGKTYRLTYCQDRISAQEITT